MTTCEHGNYREEPTYYECKTCGNVIEKKDAEMTQGDYITIAMDYLNFNYAERVYFAEAANSAEIARMTQLGARVHSNAKED